MIEWSVSVDLISVVIPCYNAAGTIEKCIQSVFRAAGETPVEIIVVDDCSTDESAEIVARLSQQVPQKLRQVIQMTNSGPAKARNAGAKVALGEYLFFLDSDTEMLPDTLARFRLRLQEADAVIGVYDAEPLNSGAVPRYKALLNNYFFVRKGVIDYEVFDSSRAGIKTQIFRDIGGFNESLGWGMDYENEELGYRLFGKCHMVLDPSVAVKHMFPGFSKLTRVYFWRVALWMEVFLARRKFESGGVTSAETGISSAALLLGLFFVGSAVLPLPSGLGVIALGCGLACLAVYLYGYIGFFKFVAQRHIFYTPIAILLNIYFTIVIAAGASWGLIRTLTSRSKSSV